MSAISGSGGGSQAPYGSGGSNNNPTPSPLSPEEEKKCKAVAKAAATALQNALGMCPSCGNPSDKCPYNKPGEGINPENPEQWGTVYEGLRKEWEDMVKQQTQGSGSGDGDSSSSGSNV